MSTAFTAPSGGKETVAVTREDHTTPAVPHDVGGGRIDIAAAVQAGFTVEESVANYQIANPVLGGRAQSLNIASLADNACSPSCSWTRTLTSTAAAAVTYTMSTTDGAGFNLSVSPSSFTLASGGTQTVTITATSSGLVPNAWEYGTVRFAASGRPAQHFPVAVSGGSADIAPDCEIPTTVVVTAQPSATVAAWNDVLEVTAAGLYPTLGGQSKPNIVFGLKVTELGLNGGLPPNGFWEVEFDPPGTPENTTYFVNLTTDTTSRPVFAYGYTYRPTPATHSPRSARPTTAFTASTTTRSPGRSRPARSSTPSRARR